MCKMINPSKPKVARVACASAVKTKFDKSLRDSQERGYE